MEEGRDHPDQAAMLDRSRGAILALWKGLRQSRRAVLEQAGLEAIHDLRVASRRFRTAVGLFEPWLAAKDTVRLKRDIVKVTRLLGRLRNIDEALLFFQAHTPAASSSGYQLCRLLSEMRPRELERIKKRLKAFDQRRLNRKVRKVAERLREGRFAAGSRFSLAAYLSDSCIKLFQPIHDLLPAATSRERQESRHALRIAIKKWRYFFEIVAPIVGCAASPVLGLLKEYQMLLGRMNDVAEFGALCGSLELTRHERGFVEELLQAEEKLLLQEFIALVEQKPLSYTSPF